VAGFEPWARGAFRMTFLLDTNVLAALSQPKPHRGVERAVTKHAGELVTASIVVHGCGSGSSACHALGAARNSNAS